MHYVPREAEKLRNKLSFELNSQRLKRKHAVHSVYTILVHGGAKKQVAALLMTKGRIAAARYGTRLRTSSARLSWDAPKLPFPRTAIRCPQGCSPKKKLGGRLKQDLDKDLQLHRILILLY